MKEILEEIKQIREGFNTPLTGILKYTAENYVNESYFGNIGNVSQENIDLFLRNIENKLEEIKKLKKKVKESDLTDVEKKYLLNNLNGSGIRFLLLKYSVYLEAEKSGYQLDESKRNSLLKKVNYLQTLLYGEEVSNTPEEFKNIIEFLAEKFKEKSNKLDPNERKQFQDFLEKFGGNMSKKVTESRSDIEDNSNQVTLSPEEVKEIMDIVIVFYGLDKDGWSSIIDPNEKNYRVNQDNKTLMIPSERTLTLKEVCKLIDHEIGVHMIRGRNTGKTLTASGEGYIEGEEGFATISEHLVEKEYDKVSLEPGNSHIATFISENYNGEQTKSLLRIYLKMIRPENIAQEDLDKQSENITRRAKRFVSYYEKGANRKDVTYGRGRTKVKEILDSGNVAEFIRNFYFSKLSLDDLNLVPEFRESLGVSDSELIFPVWIGKILYRGLGGEKGILDKIKKEDPRFTFVEHFGEETRIEIEMILGMFKDIKKKKDKFENKNQ